MTAPFSISASALRIPRAWKVHWDHISAGRIILPEVRFESLLCLSLPPDFVLDFGWCLRGDDVRFTLQINRGSFGLGDVVFFDEYAVFDAALGSLQMWLTRITAALSQQALDTDLLHRLAVIEARLRHYFIPPSGEEMEEPFARYLRRLIMKEAAAYWEGGSGDAAIQYRNRHGVVQSQLIFMFRDPHGFHIEYHVPTGPVMICQRLRRTAKSATIVHTELGGAPWHLPANQFVSRTMAARIVTAFIDQASIDCPAVGNWVVQ